MLIKLMTTCAIAILLNMGTVNCLERHNEENAENVVDLFHLIDQPKEETKETEEEEPIVVDSLNKLSLINNAEPAIVDLSNVDLEEELERMAEEEKKQEIISSIINEGLLQLGKPYVYGAKGGESFDCSMLVKHSMESKGIPCPRTSREQRSMMEYIDFDDLQRGDFIFWHKGSIEDYQNVRHVAIYLGEGKMLQATPPKVIVSDVVKGEHKGYKISYGRYNYLNEI